ncbi:hypothetical protein GCM10007304_06690 [Rhodococcoides trifolii]|uniref:GGDEF domain-containing protein n=1 Tax=Rhodococcoides trifolii TaxID=908250 RepID=A0A917FND3_9NOCA|nr:GGDEF domain-containing protein [Rhodococcus trifolii]GGF95481.1 hypothetical protein GCM10007304_06690 [Rhodococcus trifolii]
MAPNHLRALPTLSRFDAASAAVVSFLQQSIPMSMWSVTRFDGENQVFLKTSEGNTLNIHDGQARPWEQTMCKLMIDGDIPSVVPDTALEPTIARSDDPDWKPLRTYVGIPILQPDGAIFGTVCGYDTQPHSSDLYDRVPLLELLSSLLSAVLDSDHARMDAERRAATAEIEAESDPLTGLLNRRGWDRWLTPENERWLEFGDPAAVVVADLDGLKEVNDRYGHAAGDELIRRTAGVLTDWAGPTDIVARLGGDEFGILLVGSGHKTTADKVAELSGSLEHEAISMSVGFASFASTGSSVAAWNAADSVMYRVKRLSGGGRRRSSGRRASDRPGGTVVSGSR